MSNPLTRTLNLTIDLKLCGLSRPTACLHRSRTADATISRVDTIETIGNLEENELSYQTTLTQLNFLINPPSWATAARGESRLEPLSETALLHPCIDLTTKSIFRVGRSADSDVVLFHRNSSIQHALVFHDSHGSCFILDCGSSQGTFVNGVRLPPSIHSKTLCYPFRVKCGSLIRFGGPGCPVFLLKSFTHGLHAFVQRLNLTSDSLESSFDANISAHTMVIHPISRINLSKYATAADNDDQSPIAAAQLKLNTRINASGSESHLTYPDVLLMSNSNEKSLRDTDNTFYTCFQLRKRPLSDDEGSQMPSNATNECKTPLKCECFSCENDMKNPFSEGITANCMRSSIAHAWSMEETKSKQQKSPQVSNLSRILEGAKIASIKSEGEHSSTQIKKRPKRVSFANENPSFIYPFTITPDE